MASKYNIRVVAPNGTTVMDHVIELLPQCVDGVIVAMLPFLNDEALTITNLQTRERLTNDHYPNITSKYELGVIKPSTDDSIFELSKIIQGITADSRFNSKYFLIENCDNSISAIQFDDPYFIPGYEVGLQLMGREDMMNNPHIYDRDAQQIRIASNQ